MVTAARVVQWNEKRNTHEAKKCSVRDRAGHEAHHRNKIRGTEARRQAGSTKCKALNFFPAPGLQILAGAGRCVRCVAQARCRKGRRRCRVRGVGQKVGAVGQG